MPRSTLPLALCATLLAGAPVAAQDADLLAELLAANVRSMDLTESGPRGAGAEFILGEARDAEFFLLGESHGNRETPQLAAHWAEALREAGYEAIAVEIGPVTADLVVELSASEEPDPFLAFLERQPFSFPFFWWREEEAMLERFLAAGYEIWGLDQEFIGSGRFLLDRLAREVAASGAAGSEVAEQVEAWREVARRGFETFSETGDSSAAFLDAVDVADLAAFEESLPADSVEARRIVREMHDSAVVYQHYRDERYYWNNHDRVALMKRHLYDGLSGAEAGAKVLFKFGMVHMGRGYSPMRQLDLGNAAAELAVARGGSSFHLAVIARRSVAEDGSETDSAVDAPYIALLDEHRSGDDWAVFDLRALRPFFSPSRNREAHPELAELVYRYDALALAPVLHAATATVPLP